MEEYYRAPTLYESHRIKRWSDVYQHATKNRWKQKKLKTIFRAVCWMAMPMRSCILIEKMGSIWSSIISRYEFIDRPPSHLKPFKINHRQKTAIESVFGFHYSFNYYEFLLLLFSLETRSNSGVFGAIASRWPRRRVDRDIYYRFLTEPFHRSKLHGLQWTK